MKRILEKKYVKLFSIYLNPIIIGGILSSMGGWDLKNDRYFWYKSFSLVVLSLWYLISMYLYNYRYNEQDRHEKESVIKDLSAERDELKLNNEKLRHEKGAYDKGLRELTATFYDSANSLNEVAKGILSGKRKLETWSFKRVATTVCDSIYNILCESCFPEDDFSVNIMLYDMTASGRKKKNITMIAHKGKYQNKPGKFEEKMFFHENPSFYAVKLFESNKADVKILITPEEVNEKFVYIDDDHPAYSQYIAIPIVCSGNQMISLLQICTFGGCKIASTKEEISKIVARYIYPFTYYALLAYKIEKGLVNSLSIIEKTEVSNDG